MFAEQAVARIRHFYTSNTVLTMVCCKYISTSKYCCIPIISVVIKDFYLLARLFITENIDHGLPCRKEISTTIPYYGHCCKNQITILGDKPLNDEAITLKILTFGLTFCTNFVLFFYKKIVQRTQRV